MELTWIENISGDGEGEKFRMHYLVDLDNQQCLATIADPKFGCILFVTDLRIGGYDRSWMTLAAAKGYCEGVAEMENILAVEALEARVKISAEPSPAKQLAA